MASTIRSLGLASAFAFSQVVTGKRLRLEAATGSQSFQSKVQSSNPLRLSKSEAAWSGGKDTIPFERHIPRGGSMVTGAGNGSEVQTSADVATVELLSEFMVDMQCEGCAKGVRKFLEPLPGVNAIDIDVPNKIVKVKGTATVKDMVSAMESAGRVAKLIGQGSPEALGQEVTAAVAEFKGPQVFGVVRFAQVAQGLAKVEASFDGLTPGRHGWSINEFGDLTRGPDSTGGHYNPTGERHGAPDSEVRHVGDLGNLSADETGHAEYLALNDKIKVWDLVGRSIVLYEGEDNGGKGCEASSSTYENGGSGRGIAAAVIARSAGVGQNYKQLCTCDGVIIWDAN